MIDRSACPRRLPLPSRYLTLLALLAAVVFGQPESRAYAAEEPQTVLTSFLTQYCVRCHGPSKRESGLALHNLDLASGKDAAKWRQVFERIRRGEMPPEEAKQPAHDQRKHVLQSITAALGNVGETIDDRQWSSPSRGNWVDHDALFSGKAAAQLATPGRLWRLTGQAYEEFMQQKNATFRLGFKTYGPGRVRAPWELSAQEGFRDYAATHRIGEPELEQHLRNATRVARAMVEGLPKRNSLPELAALLQAGDSATTEQLQKATSAAFDGILGRQPSREERERYTGFARDNLKALGAEKALEQLLIAILFHPEVLYRVELPGTATTRGLMAPRDLARAIAYALTDREPDEALRKAAAEGKLGQRDEIRAQVIRILDDHSIHKPRILRFFQEYFGYPAALDVFKDEPTRKAAGFRGKNDWHPNFFVSDTDRLIQSILDADKNVLHELLTTPKTFALTGSTKQAEGVRKNRSSPFSLFAQTSLAIYELTIQREEWTDERPYTMPAEHRMGILTHPSWLIAHSTNFDNHAIHRGRWIRERLLGSNIPDIPVTVDAQLPDEPEKPLRERMRVTREKYCWKCHQAMDPLGLPFESFDHFGRFRTTELNQPVDTTGHVERSGDPRLDGPVKDPFELIRKLASSERVQQVFVRHAFRYFLGRNEVLEDGPILVEAHRAYVKSDGSMKALITSLLTSDAFLLRTNREAGPEAERRKP